jgi:hypothetical protein
MTWKVTDVKDDNGRIYWVDLESDVGEKVYAKWDGCVDYTEEDPDNDGNPSHLHICSLRHHIKSLQELEKKITEAYGGDWPE